jgi:hypothetical protein
MFIIELVAKNLITRVSSRKVLNPQPISYVVPLIHSVVRETPVIHIEEDPELDTLPSTIVTKHPPSPP